MLRNKGFSLIELLVVIAIIIILAAIVFPVFARAKDSAFRSSDMSHMNEIRSSLQLYREDQGAYPPALLGYATFYKSGYGTGLVPAALITGKLFPKRVTSVKTFQPAEDKGGLESGFVNPVWPPNDKVAHPAPTEPMLDLDGNGAITATLADDPPEARQRYGPSDRVARFKPAPYESKDRTEVNPFTPLTTNPADAIWSAYYYSVSGYDVAYVPKEFPDNTPQTDCWQLRYTLAWTEWGLTGGNKNDDPRQLLYSDPPDNTVITWNSWFREYKGSEPAGNNVRDIILFVGGNARPANSREVYTHAWRFKQ